MAAPAPGAPVKQGPNEFELARNRAAQQNNANLQAQKDAIKRRAAAGGSLNSGAFMKQEQLAEQQGQQNLQQANEGIDTAERAENRRLNEVKEGRDFARGEREASQQFASGESAIQRRFASEERLSSQDFAKTQQAAEITARYDLQAKQIAAAAAEGKLSREQADKQLEQLKIQSDREFGEAQKVNLVTTALSAKNSGLSPDAINALLEAIRTGQPLPQIPGFNSAMPAPAAAQPIVYQPNSQNPQNSNPDGSRKVLYYSGGRPIYADGGA